MVLFRPRPSKIQEGQRQRAEGTNAPRPLAEMSMRGHLVLYLDS